MYGLVLIRLSLAEAAVINTTTLPLHLLEDIHQSTQLAFHNYVTVLHVTGGSTLTLNKKYTPFKCDSKDPPSWLRLFSRHLLFYFTRIWDASSEIYTSITKSHMTQNLLVLVLEGIWSYMKFGLRAICLTENFHVTGSKDLKGPWVTLFSYINPRSRILDPGY
jgi:hypothetical protein